ncbi:transmembrane protein 255A isoform X1 [Amblyraja radiata]|uniref:transmembrane protein 255A isoform X1 n=1 Tax=Amblyraja radiata TaxID=386614 RepID=UPI0014028AEE|nr:transmembrane protein 255A isoform X1 [Amblyraja radiata]
MQHSLTQQPNGLTLHDSVGLFNKRKRASVLVSGSLLIASVLILTVGLAATTRTLNVSVGGYYPGVILGFGSFLGLIGSNLLENKRQMLVASIVFISFGVVASFCCAIVDGVFAARHIDIRPFHAGRCQYYSSETPYPSDDHNAEVTCPSQSRSPCILKVKSNTCYCCDLYKCGSRDALGGYYEYNDVGSCQEVIHLYHLLWSSTILNIVGLFLGIITAAVLGSFKDMQTPAASGITCAPEPPPPPIMYDPGQQVLAYTNYYPGPPHLPPYSPYDMQHPSIFSASTPSDDSQSISQSASSYMWPPNTPPRYSPAYYPPDEKPPPYMP